MLLYCSGMEHSKATFHHKAEDCKYSITYDISLPLSRATVDNRVPTVNMDRRSPEKVIPFAPDDVLGSDFNEMTMNTIDKILSNIGKDNDGLGPNWSPLERVVHKFHMWDVWYQVHEIFENKVLQNPPKPEVCSCLMDTASNGIYQVCS